jgi:hypothetical protein
MFDACAKCLITCNVLGWQEKPIFEGYSGFFRPPDRVGIARSGVLRDFFLDSSFQRDQSGIFSKINDLRGTFCLFSGTLRTSLQNQ